MHYEQIPLFPPTSAATLDAPPHTGEARRRLGVIREEATRTRALREALEPFIDLRKLRQLAAAGADLQQALTIGAVPDDVQALIAFNGIGLWEALDGLSDAAVAGGLPRRFGFGATR